MAQGNVCGDDASIAFVDVSCGLLLVLADGRGSEAQLRRKGAEIATNSIIQAMRAGRVNPDDTGGIEELLGHALKLANSELRRRRREDPALSGLAGSAVLTLVTRERAHIAHVGDSRLYLMRNGLSHRMTKDHTAARDWIDRGIMTEGEAAERPEGQRLTRVLGGHGSVEPDVRSLPLKLEKGDVLVLCTAGVHRHLADDELAGMGTAVVTENACDELCEVASQRGKGVDCKVLVYQTGYPRQKRPPRLLEASHGAKKLLVPGVVAALVAVAAIVLAVSHFVTFGSNADSVPGAPDVVSVASVPAEPDVVSVVAVPGAPDVVSVASVPAEPDVQAAEPATGQPDVELPAIVPGRPLEACSTQGLSGETGEQVGKLSALVNYGIKRVSRKYMDTSSAVEALAEARQMLPTVTRMARRRCEGAVDELQNRIKVRYLKVVSSAAWKGHRNPERKKEQCRKARKRARSAEKYGATRREIRKAMKPCLK